MDHFQEKVRAVQRLKDVVSGCRSLRVVATAAADDAANDPPSLFAMRSLTMFVPYYKETVIAPAAYLRQGNLRQVVDTHFEEWRHFCERDFFAARPDDVLDAFHRPGPALLELWLAQKRTWLKQPGRPWEYQVPGLRSGGCSGHRAEAGDAEGSGAAGGPRGSWEPWLA